MKTALCFVLQIVFVYIILKMIEGVLTLWTRFLNRKAQNLDLEKALVKESP